MYLFNKFNIFCPRISSCFFLSRYFSITVRRFLRCKKIFFIVKILRCIDFLYIRCFLILIFLNHIRRNNRLVLLFVFLCNKKRFSYISLWLTHLRLPLKHNIPLPKSAGCRMYTFFLPVYEISLNLFFPFSYPMKMAIFIWDDILKVYVVGHLCSSIISTPLYLHSSYIFLNFFSIFFSSVFRNYIIFA